MFYEISMTDKYTLVKKKKKIKTEVSEKEETKKYFTSNTKTELAKVKINDWNKVTEKCQLFKIFVTGKRRLHHQELFGLSLNLMYFEGGKKRIIETIEKYDNLYNEEKDNKWEMQIEYAKKCNYNAMNCSKFCPFEAECKHYRNIVNTVVPKNKIYKLNNNSVNYLDKDKGYEQLLNALKKGVL